MATRKKPRVMAPRGQEVPMDPEFGDIFYRDGEGLKEMEMYTVCQPWSPRNHHDRDLRKQIERFVEYATAVCVVASQFLNFYCVFTFGMDQNVDNFGEGYFLNAKVVSKLVGLVLGARVQDPPPGMIQAFEEFKAFHPRVVVWLPDTSLFASFGADIASKLAVDTEKNLVDPFKGRLLRLLKRWAPRLNKLNFDAVVSQMFAIASDMAASEAGFPQPDGDVELGEQDDDQQAEDDDEVWAGQRELTERQRQSIEKVLRGVNEGVYEVLWRVTVGKNPIETHFRADKGNKACVGDLLKMTMLLLVEEEKLDDRFKGKHVFSSVSIASWNIKYINFTTQRNSLYLLRACPPQTRVKFLKAAQEGIKEEKLAHHGFPLALQELDRMEAWIWGRLEDPWCGIPVDKPSDLDHHPMSLRCFRDAFLSLTFDEPRRRASRERHTLRLCQTNGYEIHLVYVRGPKPPQQPPEEKPKFPPIPLEFAGAVCIGVDPGQKDVATAAERNPQAAPARFEGEKRDWFAQIRSVSGPEYRTRSRQKDHLEWDKRKQGASFPRRDMLRMGTVKTARLEVLRANLPYILSKVAMVIHEKTTKGYRRWAFTRRRGKAQAVSWVASHIVGKGDHNRKGKSGYKERKVIVGMGDWSQTKGFKSGNPLVPLKDLKRELGRRPNVWVVDVDESYTSKRCSSPSCCKGVNTKKCMELGRKGGYRVLSCTSCETLYHRDVNGSRNILTALEHLVRREERPTHLMPRPAGW